MTTLVNIGDRDRYGYLIRIVEFEGELYEVVTEEYDRVLIEMGVARSNREYVSKYKCRLVQGEYVRPLSGLM